jgi:threonine dehydrogenase-like Zn-dependent dehydrogenase
MWLASPVRATIIHEARDIRVEDVPDATIREPTDALVRVTHACICGSDLWPYRGELMIYGLGGRTGHEFIGVVEDVGAEVETLRPGDRVIAPSAFSDGTCEFCQAGLHTSCVEGGYWGGTNDGGQGEAVRAPLADGTLVPLRPEVDLEDARLVASLAALTDVMATGHHAAYTGGVVGGPRWQSSATGPWASARCWPRGGSAPSGSSPSGTTPGASSSRSGSVPRTS